MALRRRTPKAGLPDGVVLAATLRGHSDHIGRIAWSPDGRLLATPSRDGTVRVWDGATGQHVHTVTGHPDLVRAAAFDRGGKILATGGDDGAVRLWRVGSWRPLSALTVPDCQVLEFSPTEHLLGIGVRGWAEIYDVRAEEVRHRLHEGAVVTALAFDPSGRTLATGTPDGDVRLWDAAEGVPTAILDGHSGTVTSVAFAPDGRTLATSGWDHTIKVWDRLSGRLVTTLEGHTGAVRSVSFLSDGRLLASKGTDGRVRLWACDTWMEIAALPEADASSLSPTLAFHPTQPILATVGSDGSLDNDSLVHVWRLDPDRLLRRWSQPANVTYTSAKIVLVGDSGVGKTGLGFRLVTGRFKEHPSTHGQQFWVMDQLGATRVDGAQCEAVLWDLAGQPDYRLIHALFLDDADIALVLFDPTRDDDPLRGVDYWLRQLGPGREIVLVAARSDRGSARLAGEEIERFRAERGIRAYIETSALEGGGLTELVEVMRSAIRWDERPTTVTTATFKWIKDTVLGLKEGEPGERVILSPQELRERLERDGPARRFTDAEMLSAVGHLANHGYVALLRTSTNEMRILLAPELLNNVAASIVLEARRNPKGLGSLEERRVLAGDYPFPELAGLSTGEREALLDAAVGLFLSHNVCFRETDPLSSRVYLVFPELINLRRPALEDAAVEEGAAYTVTGAIENVYASLVVLLGYTDVFARAHQWRSQAEYAFGDGQVCGFRLEAEREGELDLVLYFGVDMGEPIRRLFQSLFESFLARRDVAVRRFEAVECSKGHRIHRAVVRERLAAGAIDVFCTGCGEQLSLARADEPIRLTRGQSRDVQAQRHTAGQRSRFEQAVFRLKTYVTQTDQAQPTCFISYAWGNREQERWVSRELATDLAKAGITVILDRWENGRIGASVPRFIERVHAADRVVVVGTPLYRRKYDNREAIGGFVLAAEADLISMRMIGGESRKETVLPILLEGTEKDALPPLLQGRVYGDFRRPDDYFLTTFDLILSVHGIMPRDPVGAELREEIRDFLSVP